MASTLSDGPTLGERETRIKLALETIRAGCDVDARRAADPVAFVHRYEDPADQELVALTAACIAFGNVKTIRTKATDLLARVGPSPTRAAGDLEGLRARLSGWKHRVFRGDDIARLLVGARRVQELHGSLGALFQAELAKSGSMRDGLAALCDAIRTEGGLRRGGRRRGPAHLLPDPRGQSGNKRLLLFLRWMVRGPDGIDLGLWQVDPALLLVPVDVHIHKLAQNLGFTRRLPGWRATEEITRALARLDPTDPTKYDFSLCHMGMLRRCPSRRDAVRCEGCGVKPVCVHWTRKSRGASASARSGRFDERIAR